VDYFTGKALEYDMLSEDEDDFDEDDEDDDGDGDGFDDDIVRLATPFFNG
jgi:nucleosome assembly protein 1-like 1